MVIRTYIYDLWLDTLHSGGEFYIHSYNIEYISQRLLNIGQFLKEDELFNR